MIRKINLPLSSGASHCFDDPPSPTLERPTQPSLLISNLPGVVYDADKQCEYLYSTSNYKKCPENQVSVLVNFIFLIVLIRNILSLF